MWTHSGSGVWDPGPNPFSFGEFPIVGALHKDGEFVGGVHVGYNWQFAPTWVAGIEGDWSWTDAKASFTQSWINTVVGVRPDSRTTLSLKEDWLSTVRARIGYRYATLPWCISLAVPLGASSTMPPTPTRTLTYVATSQFSKTAAGYVLGGGFEYAFWGNWSARAEYLYYHRAPQPRLRLRCTGNFRLHLPIGLCWSGGTNINSIRAGVSYKFFWAAPSRHAYRRVCVRRAAIRHVSEQSVLRRQFVALNRGFAPERTSLIAD